MCGIKRNGLTIRYNQPYIALEAHACPFARQWAPAGTPRIRMTDSVWTPLLLSLKVAGWATALNLILGVGAAYGLARTRSQSVGSQKPEIFQVAMSCERLMPLPGPRVPSFS